MGSPASPLPIERAEPILAKFLTEKVEPRFTKSNAEHALPNLLKLRKLRLLPQCNESKIEKLPEPPTLTCDGPVPVTDMPDPIRTICLIENEEPHPA